MFESWYTEPEKLIRNGLVRDITDILEERGWLDSMSPAIRDLLSDDETYEPFPFNKSIKAFIGIEAADVSKTNERIYCFRWIEKGRI